MTIKQTRKTICHVQYNQDMLSTKMYHHNLVSRYINVHKHVNRITPLPQQHIVIKGVKWIPKFPLVFDIYI